MKKFLKKVLLSVLVVSMLFSITPVSANAAVKLKASKTKIVIKDDDAYPITVTFTGKKKNLSLSDVDGLYVRWSGKWKANKRKLLITDIDNVNKKYQVKISDKSNKKRKIIITVIVDLPEDDNDDSTDEDITDDSNTKGNTTEDNIKKLKTYIQNNGNTNTDGNLFISEPYSSSDSSELFGIVFDSSSDSLEFICSSESEYTDSVVKMVYTGTEYYATITFATIYNGIDMCASAKAKIDPSMYYEDEEIQFYDIESENIEDSDVNEEGSLLLQIGFLGWDKLLGDTIGYSLSDIGFTSYKI